MQIVLSIGQSLPKDGNTGMLIAGGEPQSNPEQEQRVIDACKFMRPIPTIKNPEFVDFDTTPEIPPLINEFTDSEYPQEYVRQHLINIVARFEQRKALDAVQIQPDPTLIS